MEVQRVLVDGRRVLEAVAGFDLETGDHKVKRKECKRCRRNKLLQEWKDPESLGPLSLVLRVPYCSVQ